MNNAKGCAKIIGVTSTGEEVCAASGRISTCIGSALEIFEKSHDKDKNTSLIGKVTASGHTSTTEHCFFNIAFSEVSVVVEQFMIEFRLASFTVQSRRYVDFRQAGYYVPDFKNREIREKFVSVMDSLFVDYDFLVENGVPKEDARFVLPYCFKSNFFCSLNARELVNVIKSMLYGRGRKYPELVELGKSLLSQAHEYAPGIFADFENRSSNVNDEPDFSFIEGSSENKAEDYVTLLSYTPDAERVIAATALAEKTALSQQEILTAVSSEAVTKKVIERVVSSSRPRALENALFTFRLSRVSLACLTHFARHRIHTIMVPDLNTCRRDSYIIPETVVKDEALLERYNSCFEKMLKLYKEINACDEDKNSLIYVLLAGNTIDIVSSMNARELLLFFKLRTCSRAQWEIQNFANLMLAQCRKAAPGLFSFYGPSCFVTGKCPEGRFSCGKAAEVKERYSV